MNAQKRWSDSIARVPPRLASNRRSSTKSAGPARVTLRRLAYRKRLARLPFRRGVRFAAAGAATAEAFQDLALDLLAVIPELLAVGPVGRAGRPVRRRPPSRAPPGGHGDRRDAREDG